MILFSDFLTEETKMVGGIGAKSTSVKSKSHLLAYVAPYLSDKARKGLASNFKGHLSDKEISSLSNDKHGAQHSPDPSDTTHVLGSNHGPFKKGTKVKVTDARVDDNGRIMLSTAQHGEIPMSLLEKPAALKRERKTEGGFELEKKIANNLGTQAAGSTGTAWDYHYRGGEGGIVGKARKIETDKPYLRGEAKQNKASMGTSQLNYDPETKTWDFSNKKLRDKFAEAVHPDTGLSILDHLNKYHSDGVISKGMTLKAPAGSARAYLDSIGANSLHLHRTEAASKKKAAIDHGTTFTVGDDNPLANRIGMGHLNSEDLDKLDGHITIEKTAPGAPGSVKVAHKPDIRTFKQYADYSKTDPENHRDLSNVEHARHIRGLIDHHIASLNAQAAPAPAQAPVMQQQPMVQRSTPPPVATPMQIAAQRMSRAAPASRPAPQEDEQRFADEGGGAAIGNKPKREFYGNDGTHGGYIF